MEMRNLQKPGVSQTWIQRKSRSFLPYLCFPLPRKYFPFFLFFINGESFENSL